MLNVHSCVGTWRFAKLLGVSSTSADPVNFGALWIIPPVGGQVENSSINGYIKTHSKNDLGERECFHIFADGDVCYLGVNNFRTEMIAPYSSSTATFQRHTYVASGNVSRSIYGPVIFGTVCSYHCALPNHVYLGTEYRNVTYDITNTDSNVLVSTFSYDSLMKGIWKTTTMTSTVQLDPTNYRYRFKRTNGWNSWIDCSYFQTSVPHVSPSSLSWRDFKRCLVQMASIFSSPDRSVFGDLAVRCADDARSIDVNTLEYLRDIANVTKDVKSVYSLLKGKVSLESISSLYLSWKYGLRLTYSDTRAIAKDVQYLTSKPRRDYSVARAAESRSQSIGGITLNALYHYKVFYAQHSSEFLSGISKLQSAGLFPSPKTTWELIPFSFAVDWFTGLSDRLNSLDAQLSWSTHAVLGTTMSLHKSYTGVPLAYLGLNGYAGSLSVGSYSRFTPRECVLPEYFSDTPRNFKNYVELSALLLQKLKK